MKNKSTEKAKPNTKRVRFNLYAPKTERVSLEGDLNGCVLVIPEIFGINRPVKLYQERLSEYHL